MFENYRDWTISSEASLLVEERSSTISEESTLILMEKVGIL